MALMYDMETVNRAMTEAASFVASGGTEREKYILNTFAAMKPVEAEPVVHARWVPIPSGYRCSACGCFKKKNKKERCICGAIMDGRREE